MAIHGYKGGVISATPPTTSVSGASGVWTPDDALQAGANWPVAPALSSNSVRLRASASAYMSRTPSVAGNQKTWTFSAWVKPSLLNASSVGLIEAATDSNNRAVILFPTTQALQVFFSSGGSTVCNLVTTAVYRDPASWYHFLVAVDTTQATDSNRVKVYVNGTQVTSFSTSTYPTQNFNTQFNTTVANVIGAGAAYSPTAFFDGYMTEINFIDGQALTPNYFGAVDAATGVWQPATYRGTYGTNGFYLPMNKTVEDYSIDYLVVAGGAGGGSGTGGGGGAGGLSTGTISVVSSAVYTVTVGSGGTAGIATGGSGGAGGNSVFSSITAIGGGSGGTGYSGGVDGGSGGSGGGGGPNNHVGGSGTSGQGYGGGSGSTGSGGAGSGVGYNAGGGGGAGAVGADATTSASGNGGTGLASSISGSSTYYAGGGGGGRDYYRGITTGGTGGSGGGGSATNTVGGNGTANTGGGGAGGANGPDQNGGAGGSGVVILRILTSQYTGTTTGSPTVTTDGSYTVVKFTSSGSYTA